MSDRGVLVVSPGGWSRHGGIEVYARTIVRSLRDRFPDKAVDLVDSRGEGKPASWPRFVAAAAARLRREGRQGLTGIAHIQVSERSSFLRKAILLRAAKSGGMPVVLHHHGADVIPFWDNGGPAARALVRWTTKSADMNVVLGAPWQRWLIDVVGVPADRVEVLYNGIPDLPQPPAPVDTAPQPLRPLLLAVLSDRKGCGDYLEALAQLRARGVEIRATAAGGGADLERFRQMAADKGLADCCDFPGWVQPEDVPAMLARHDLYVLPSYREGLPIGILESMRGARPVITTSVGAIPEAFPPGNGVNLIQPGDPGAMADLMQSYAGDRERLQTDGLAARDLFLHRFTLDRHLEQLLGIYEKVTTQTAGA